MPEKNPEDMTSNERLCLFTNQDPIGKQIQKRKWGWIGHTIRKPAKNITKQALRWNPQGKRKKGRPKTPREETQN